MLQPYASNRCSLRVHGKQEMLQPVFLVPIPQYSAKWDGSLRPSAELDRQEQAHLLGKFHKNGGSIFACTFDHDFGGRISTLEYQVKPKISQI